MLDGYVLTFASARVCLFQVGGRGPGDGSKRRSRGANAAYTGRHDATAIKGDADLLINGTNSATSFTLAQCLWACDSNAKCRSFIFSQFYDGYCEIWSKTGPRIRGVFGYTMYTRPGKESIGVACHRPPL